MWTVGTGETKGKEVHISRSNMMGMYSHFFPIKSQQLSKVVPIALFDSSPL